MDTQKKGEIKLDDFLLVIQQLMNDKEKRILCNFLFSFHKVTFKAYDKSQ